MSQKDGGICNDLSKIDKLLFGIRRSIRYHNRRRAHYDRLHNLSMFLSALAGTAIIASILGKMGSPWALVLAALVTVFSILDLIVGTTKMARLHHDLVRRFISLEKKIVTSADQPDDGYAEYWSERLDIEADEPPPMNVLNMVCHNEMLRAMGYPIEDQVEIKWYLRWFCNWFDWREHSILNKQ